MAPEVRQAFISTGEGSVATGGDATSVPETAVRKVGAAAKTAVIKRDIDFLAKEDVSGLSREVSAAILEELTIWVKYTFFERRPLKGTHTSWIQGMFSDVKEPMLNHESYQVPDAT